MSPDMEDIIIEGKSKTVKEAKTIADKISKQTLSNSLHDWFLTKGWIYFMVFIMGILVGGLIFK